MRGPVGPLYLLLISLVTADGLRVTMEAPLISVMRDEDVTIPCTISEFSPGSTITVSWTKSQNGIISDVYSYIPGRPVDHRAGSYMEEESEIQRGNAALHIPRGQFSDDGEYTCMAIVTPEAKEGRSTLQVSAAPSAALVPGDGVTVELGSEKVVSCEVTNFYPKDIAIRWVRYEKDSPQCVVLDRGTCTSEAVTNTDGTFNISSQLTLYPTLRDDGQRYSCAVQHRALQHELRINFTLTVTEREDNSGTVVAAVVITFLLVTLLLLAGLLYYQVFNKDPPSLSEITGNDHLIDMNRTTLTCNIMNFKPRDLEIAVYLKRRGENMRIHTWRSGDANAGGASVNIDLEQQGLMNGDVSHTPGTLDLEMKAVITPNKSRLFRCIPWDRLYSYSCHCSIHITPSFHDDNGAEFSVQVSHPALTAPVSQQRTLRVIGVAPRLLKIVRPAIVTNKELTTLTCPITGFKPKPLHITWLKKGQDHQETELVTWNSNDGNNINDDIHKVTEDEQKDQAYSFLSVLTLRPNVTEDGVTYICRTFHPPTDQRAEEELVLDVTAVPVLDPIKLLQEKVHPGDTMKLSCKIHSFYPAPIEITWQTEDGRTLSSTISDVLHDTSGLHHVTSTMTYTPTMKDWGKTFTCEVRHRSTGAPRKATWRLEDLVSEPAVTEICCDPPAPQCDKMVTLSCHVSDLYPNELTVQWHKGRSRIPPDMCRENLQEDPESGAFRGTVEVTFTADNGCHEEEYRMELIHCNKVIERKFRLILGDFSRFPLLGDITSVPSNPSIGQSVTLHCKVTNSNPQDIEVKWLKGEKPLKKGQGEEKRITEEDGSVSCSLQITATALDYGKAYTCSVTHKDMAGPLKKNYYLPLPDKAPLFSHITVSQRPVAGEEAVFTVTISGFTPEIRVKWYKDFNPFPSDVITTSDPQIGKDFLCTCSSSLRFTPQDNDHGASIRCEATHSVTKKVYEQQYSLHLSERPSGEPAGRPPPSTAEPGLKLPLKTRGIQCLTENPRVGDKVTLTCYVHGCDAGNAEFYWSKGLFPIESENKTLEDGSGSFSTVTFIAQEGDRDCTVTGEVNFNFETREERFTLKLQ